MFTYWDEKRKDTKLLLYKQVKDRTKQLLSM